MAVTRGAATTARSDRSDRQSNMAARQQNARATKQQAQQAADSLKPQPQQHSVHHAIPTLKQFWLFMHTYSCVLMDIVLLWDNLYVMLNHSHG